MPFLPALTPLWVLKCRTTCSCAAPVSYRLGATASACTGALVLARNPCLRPKISCLRPKISCLRQGWKHVRRITFPAALQVSAALKQTFCSPFPPVRVEGYNPPGFTELIRS